MSNSQLFETANHLLTVEEEWAENPTDVWGIPTGFECMDIALGGLQRQELIVLAALPGHGKSTLGNQIAFKVANRLRKDVEDYGDPPKKAILISPEMKRESIILREASAISGVSSYSIKTGKAPPGSREKFRKALTFIRDKLTPYIDIYAEHNYTVGDIANIVGGEMEGTVELLLVDYITQLKRPHQKNDHHEVGEIAETLKSLALSYDIPVLALAQVNRDAQEEDKDGNMKPLKPSMIAGSRRIEEVADVILLMQREKETINADLGVPATVEIAKNRDGGQGFITMNFDISRSRFRDLGVKLGLQMEGR